MGAGGGGESLWEVGYPSEAVGEGVLNVNGNTFKIGSNYYIFSLQCRSSLYPSI